jgi:hypothetical protein
MRDTRRPRTARRQPEQVPDRQRPLDAVHELLAVVRRVDPDVPADDREAEVTAVFRRAFADAAAV